MHRAKAMKTMKLVLGILMAAQTILAGDVTATRGLVPDVGGIYGDINPSIPTIQFSQQGPDEAGEQPAPRNSFPSASSAEYNQKNEGKNTDEQDTDGYALGVSFSEDEAVGTAKREGSQTQEQSLDTQTTLYQHGRYGQDSVSFIYSVQKCRAERSASSTIFDLSSLLPYLLVIASIVSKLTTVNAATLANNPFLAASLGMLVLGCLAILLPPLKRAHGIFLPVYINFSILQIGCYMIFFLRRHIATFLSNLQSEEYMSQLSEILDNLSEYFDASDKSKILDSTRRMLENIRLLSDSLYFQAGMVIIIAILTFLTLCYFLSFRCSLEKFSLVQIPLLVWLSFYSTNLILDSIKDFASKCNQWYCLPLNISRMASSLANNRIVDYIVGNEALKMLRSYIFEWMPFLTVLIVVLWAVFMIDIIIWNVKGGDVWRDSDYDVGLETRYVAYDEGDTLNFNEYEHSNISGLGTSRKPKGSILPFLSGALRKFLERGAALSKFIGRKAVELVGKKQIK